MLCSLFISKRNTSHNGGDPYPLKWHTVNGDAIFEVVQYYKCIILRWPYFFSGIDNIHEYPNWNLSTLVFTEEIYSLAQSDEYYYCFIIKYAERRDETGQSDTHLGQGSGAF